MVGTPVPDPRIAALDPPPSERPPKRYDAFLSYSHAADLMLAPELQRALQQLGKRWYRRRALEVFRDDTGLAVSPALWPSICAAMDGSRHLVVLASPAAASSEWVGKEIERWLATRGPESILLVVTEGTCRWDDSRNDFDPDVSDALPPALFGAFATQPLYLDLGWARRDVDLTLRNGRFRDAVAGLAAPMHGTTKDELEGEDVRQHRRTQKLRTAVIAALAVLVLLVGTLAVASIRRGQTVQRQLDAANAESLGGLALARSASDPDVATQFALLAYRADPTSPAAREAVARSYLTHRAVDRLVSTAPATIEATQASRDGRVIALLAGGTAQVLTDPLDGAASWTLPDVPRTARFALSGDGRWVVATSTDGSLRLWDTVRRTGPVVLQPPRAAAGGPGAAVVTGDGRHLVYAPPLGSTPRPVRLWSLPDLAPLPDGFDLRQEPDVDSVAASDDLEQVVLARPGSRDGAVGPGSAARSMRTGAVLREITPDTVVATGMELGCDGVSGDQKIVARDMVTGAETRRWASLPFGPTCGAGGRWLGVPPEISADGTHVVERAGGYRPGREFVRIASLVDGSRWWAEVPRETVDQVGLTRPPAPPAVLTGGQAPRLLAPDGRSLALVELHPEVVPPRPESSASTYVALPQVASTRDGRFLLSQRGQDVSVVDVATGRVLAVKERLLSADDRRAHGLFVKRDGLSALDDVGPHWVRTEFALPDLGTTRSDVIPCTPGANGMSATRSSGLLISLCGAVLAARDERTGEVVSIPLGATPQERDRYRGAQRVVARPGHPGQVAIDAPGSLAEIWSLTEQRRIHVLPGRPPTDGMQRLTFDRSGAQLFAYDGASVTVWDADTAQQVRPPFAAPDVIEMREVTEDGYLLTEDGDSGLVFWDVTRGSRSGVFPLSQSLDESEPDGRTLSANGPYGSTVVALNGREWFDNLCRLADRPTTSEEERLLPPGADPSPPCG
ncbi:TIR domain-containing protein [Actinomycetospora aeridis]|uniref:TIR domain-containing protein n=1 Tax=Actinomycetospora aeridis TaxID=3129231 RepID=A0ABU8N153_9PSEU